MVTVKSSADAAKNFRAGAGRAPQAYKEGIARTQGWQQKAVEGQGLYEEKMRDASVLGRRRRSLEKVSDADWKSRAMDKGANSIGTAMAASADKYQKGVEPHLQTIASITLPPRTADGMANLVNRAGPIVQALQAKKREIKG